MIGLRKFLGETWWVFLAAVVMAITIGYLSGMWLYYVFPVFLVPVILYMSAVRYDSDGNLRDEMRR